MIINNYYCVTQFVHIANINALTPLHSFLLFPTITYNKPLLFYPPSPTFFHFYQFLSTFSRFFPFRICNIPTKRTRPKVTRKRHIKRGVYLQSMKSKIWVFDLKTRGNVNDLHRFPLRTNLIQMLLI